MHTIQLNKKGFLIVPIMIVNKIIFNLKIAILIKIRIKKIMFGIIPFLNN